MVSKVWATEGGLRGIYKGLVPTLAREVPGNALMFGAYEALKQKARQMQVHLLQDFTRTGLLGPKPKPKALFLELLRSDAYKKDSVNWLAII